MFSMNAVKAFALAVAICIAGFAAAAAFPTPPAGQRISPLANSPAVAVDWQSPQSLPRRFRNHCYFDVWRRRSYCADHCGLYYQFYYCSRESFGCCRVGYGYCDWSGLLRCAP